MKKKAKARKPRKVDPRDFEVLYPHEVGHEVRVLWSNGAGFSVYKIADNPKPLRSSCDVCNGKGADDGGNFCRACTDDPSHLFEAVGHWEYTEGGPQPLEL